MSTYCKTCAQISNAAWRKKAAKSDYRYQAHIKSKYQLTLADTQRLRRMQRDRCGVCRKPFGDKRPVIDHDHSNGRTRGLLCGSCNRGLGLLGDTLAALRRAVRYLEKEYPL